MTGAFGKARPYWPGYVLTAVLVLMSALRIRSNFAGSPAQGAAFLGLGFFSALMLLEFLFSSRLRWPWMAYFALQSACLLLMCALRPFLDVIASLFLPLMVQAFYTLPRRTAYAWAAGFSLMLAAALTRGLGLVEGLAQALAVIAEGIILTTFAMLVVRSQKDREESQALVLELQEAQRRLQEQAAQAGQLAAERERNLLARELHDSVGQMMFSIELTCESARVLLERDPAQVPAMLDRLQEMSGAALTRLRSIISDLRPQGGANTIEHG